MEILSRVIKKSLIIILPATGISLVFGWEKVPLGILAGWFFGVLNFRALSRNVTGLLASEKAVTLIVLKSMTRILTLFAAVAFLLYIKVINAFGLLFGFTVVFALILLEGLREGRAG